jgi:hypothetical protein
MYSVYRGSSGSAIVCVGRCTLCTEDVHVQQCVCVCGADVHCVQKKFRYNNVCVWCRCTVCTDKYSVYR